jgi:hypothetical protein
MARKSFGEDGVGDAPSAIKFRDRIDHVLLRVAGNLGVDR